MSLAPSLQYRKGAMMLKGALLMYKLVQQASGCDAEAFVPGLRGVGDLALEDQICHCVTE